MFILISTSPPCNGLSVNMVVYLRKNIRSLLSVFKKKGE